MAPASPTRTTRGGGSSSAMRAATSACWPAMLALARAKWSIWTGNQIAGATAAFVYGVLVVVLHLMGVPDWMPGWVPLWR